MSGQVFLYLIALTGLAGASEWRSIGPWGGSATAIAIDPQQPAHLLAGTHTSLLYFSDDAGAHWRALPFPRHFIGDIRVVRFDPRDSKHLLVGVQLTNSEEAGLYDSRDGGAHWEQLAGLRGRSVDALAMADHDPQHWIAGTRDGAFVTTDGGQNWQRLTPADNDELHSVTAIALDPADAGRIYVGTPHLPWKTTDGGRSWRPMHTGMIDDSDVMSIAVDRRAPQRIYASACSGIYHSESQGDRWSKFTGNSDSQRRTHVIQQDEHHPERLYAGTTAGLLRSTDGGATWRQLNRYEINGLAIDPKQAGVLYLATERSGIVKSTDGGETFVASNEGFANRVVSAVTRTPHGWLALVRPDAVGASLYTSANGADWRVVEGAKPPAGNLLANAGNALLLRADNGRLMRSTDSGVSWREVPALAAMPVEALQTAGDAAVLSTVRAIRRSTDGLTWTDVTVLRPDQALHRFSVSPDGQEITAVTGAAEAMLSRDGGRHWSSIALPAQTRGVHTVVAAGATLLMAANSGLWRSADGGVTWQPVTQGVPGGTVTDVLFLDSTGREAIASYFGSVYRSRDAGLSWEQEAKVAASAPRFTQLLSDGPRIIGKSIDTGLSFLVVAQTP